MTDEQVGAIIGTVTAYNTLKLHLQQLISMGLVSVDVGEIDVQRERVLIDLIPKIDSPWLADFLSGFVSFDVKNFLEKKTGVAH